MPLPTLLGAALLAAAPPLAHPRRTTDSHSTSAGAVLIAEGEDGFGQTGETWTAGRESPIPIPLVVRAAGVQRAVPDSRGIRLRVSCEGTGAMLFDAVAIRAVSHPDDSQLLVEGGAERGDVLLVGPPILPVAVDLAGDGPPTARDGLPLLARQDGLGTTHAVARIEPPSELPTDARLLAIGLDAERRARLAGPAERSSAVASCRTAYPIASAADLAELSLSPLDQLFYATVRELPRGAGTPLALASARLARGRAEAREPETVRADVLASLAANDGEAVRLGPGELLELSLAAPPPSGAGTTWTLLVELVAGPAMPDAAPLPAAAEREPDEGLWTLAEPPGRIGGQDVVHFEGPDLQLDIRPTMGPGLACGDVDGDSDPDLYLVQGGGRAGSRPPRNRMLENLSTPGAFAFRDVTEPSGTGDPGAGMGALFFDAEGDGDLDLYVANYGADVLYLNDGSGVFTDRSREAGVGGDRWSAGIAAADTDLDGDLDLYVTSYLSYDERAMPTDGGFDRYQREDPIAMLPFAFPGERNLFLRNDTVRRTDAGLETGPFRFTDVTDELGLADEEGRGMQPVFWDFDRDGDQDLYVANDVSMNGFFRNEGDGRFENVSFTTGMDDPRGGMGVSVGDVDGDGDEDLFLTNWQLEPNALYLNNLVTTRSRKSYIASFRDTIVRSGLGRWGVGVTSWGAELFDADLDGDLDLYVANGYTSPDYESTGICVGQGDHFFLGDGEGRFVPAMDTAPFELREPSRAALACDLDRDGDPDLVVTSNNGPAVLLENRADRRPDAGWLGLQLAGRGANSRAIGAEVRLHAGERLVVRTVRAGTSYLAGNPPELLFGLGAHEGPVELEIRWPSGRESRHRVTELDRWLVLEEPQ